MAVKQEEDIVRASPAVAAAKQALVFDGAVPDAVAARLTEAERRGDAAAAMLLATLHASGAWLPADWGKGLDHLQRAAELGWASAQDQLALLAPMGGDWATRRAAIDADALLMPPARHTVCEAPRVRTCERLISPAMCDWLVGRAQGRLMPARMADRYDSEGWISDERTCTVFMFTVFDADIILALARARISTLLKMSGATFEPPQIFNYRPGQELKPHVDYLQRGKGEAGGYAGERIASFLLYLNDDFEGGETWFVRPDLKVRPDKGGGVYFANVDSAGRADPSSLHAGLTPTRGEKWLLSQWIHDRPFTGRV